ncbi:Pkinase-domain-containing [Chlorella sorokiniana]|uniref:Pkinase-domain-containing n=1 Tax=Chlorella sorokiniana TaxID=3076 RepID=A0A2P6U4V3_CHLSO|nr:Pkinase-domain-containing [Chlorella sorokiniana]|eukprot:PRW61339.1 Pkinase-domain-containing [Chlorella sorokiniana]
MGCAGSTPAKPAAAAVETEVAYPEDGKKLRRDATLEQEYDLGGQLGEGGYSRVKLATHRETGQQYAIKIIPLPKPGQSVNKYLSNRGAIMKEIDALLDLDHPNVVGLKEYFVQNNRVYLVMELLQGGELLDSVLEQGHYSEADARTVFRQVVLAIQYIHSQGIVHRDLKLDNLLLVTPGNISNIKIVDFGFARKEHAGSAGRLNNMQTVCGTPGYIAPEVIRGIMQPSGDPVKEGCEDPNHHYGPPCDLWSAGIVLYMLLSGMPPFYDKSEPRLLRSIISGKFSFKDPVWEPVSGEAKDLIRKLLVVDPAQRLTCEQVLEHPWMQGSGGAEHLPRTAARIQDAITRRRSSSRLTLQQRISEAIDASRSVTPTVSRTL